MELNARKIRFLESNSWGPWRGGFSLMGTTCKSQVLRSCSILWPEYMMSLHLKTTENQCRSMN
jgi:hypothetical protein